MEFSEQKKSELRPALLAVDHPLNYVSTFTEVKPQTPDEKVEYLFERGRVEDLLNEYAYRLDTIMVDHSLAHLWAGLFTDDCQVTYPFGAHRGVSGLAEWLSKAVSRFARMTHMSSNFTIKFESQTFAHGRSVLMGTCGLHPTDLGQVFFEGGYYNWSFRKVDGDWKISFLYLDMNWTGGDSLGLNEEDHPT